MKASALIKTSLFLLLCTGFLLPSFAQINVPPLSPRSELRQNVGFGTITIDYSRPSMRGRVIFGDLVPYNELWRTGANECTTISFSEKVHIEGETVPPGKYALFTIPDRDAWTIILNKKPNLWGTHGYDQNFDLVRFKVTPDVLDEHVETFSILLGELTQSTARLFMEWENTRVSFLVSTDADNRIVTEIEEKLRDPMVEVANTYYSSANYYLTTHRDLDQAMAWMDQAIELQGEKSYYLSLKAKIFAAQDKYAKAIQFARRALEQAKREENEYQVRLNEKLIQKWKDTSGSI